MYLAKIIFATLVLLILSKSRLLKIMGSSYSKLWKPIPYTCHDIGHTWNPSCTASTTEVALICFEEGVKIYSSVYFVSFF